MFENLPDLITSTELATLTRRSRSAVLTERHRGEAPASLGIRVGRRVLWRKADLADWFEQQQAESTANAATRRGES